MSALRSLRQHGFRLEAADGQLIVTPRSALTDDLRALIRAQKRAILNELGVLETESIARQTKVEAELRARPDHRLAFDVADAGPKAAAGTPVSVVLAVRHGKHILPGELHLPRERWDMVMFLRTVADSGTGRPS